MRQQSLLFQAKSVQKHYQWITQKLNLNQDMLLISPPPTSYSRKLLLSYLQKRELKYEYISLTSDTTESDLKQRRELNKKSVIFQDQAPVRAAINGRILILDGLEKCERNVLPTLNNLLENREMNLDDGRFLVSSKRYSELLKSTTKDQLINSGIIPVHPNFFVVGLTYSCPPFHGRSIDPPLRSRFQIRRMEFPSTSELISLGMDEKIVQIVTTINTAADIDPKLIPRIPFMNVEFLSILRQQMKMDNNLLSIITRSYPWILDGFHSFPQKKPILSLIHSNNQQDKNEIPKVMMKRNYDVSNKRKDMIEHCLQDLSIGRDILICGSIGAGKSFCAKIIGKERNQNIQVFSLYRDMTSRDLLGRRSTNEITGDTYWEPSPLVTAAKNGDILILDGIEKFDTTLNIITRLCEDRSLQFLDGSDINISKDFRIIALASTLNNDKSSYQFLTPDLLGMFSFHLLPNLNRVEIEELLKNEFPNIPSQNLTDLLNFKTLLETKGKEANLGILSIRSLFRICKRLNAFPNTKNVLFDQIRRSLLIDFLPKSQRDLVNVLLSEANIHFTLKTEENAIKTIGKETVQIGSITFPRFASKNRPDLIPQVLFYDVPHHRQTLYEMLADFKIGFRNFILIGNQGVGKNKLADRMLELLNMEREYIQLHRDSTVNMLIGIPTLKNGQVVWEDSPLVKACKYGRVLVVDEADKAPPEVIAVLKSLVEDGEMLLGNGKRLVFDSSSSASEDIKIHPDFCVWILSNRPGFPFHGNNFFKQVGDVFSTHIVNNPDTISEIELLRKYGPTTNIQIIETLVKCFQELRQLSDEALISYPYSTREAVNVVKHLEAYPEDGVVLALRNVLDFDYYRPEIAKIISQVFQKNGIPFIWEENVHSLESKFGQRSPLPKLTPSGEIWKISP